MVPVLRAKKIEKLGLFLSQHLTNHIALPVRDPISPRRADFPKMDMLFGRGTSSCALAEECGVGGRKGRGPVRWHCFLDATALGLGIRSLMRADLL